MACLFWTAVLLLDYRRDTAAQHVLAAFMGVAAALYLCHALFYNRVATLAYVADCVYAFCNLAVFPLYYLYIRRLTTADGRRRLVVLLPAAAVCVWTIVLRVWFGGDAGAEAVRQMTVKVLFLIELVPVSVFGYRRLTAFDHKVANYYADTEGRTLKSTRSIMWVLLGGAFLSGIANFIGREYFVDSVIALSVPSILFTVLLFSVGYVGARQQFSIDTLERDTISDEHRDDTPTSEPVTASSDAVIAAAETAKNGDSELLQRLDALMEEEQLFLKHDLRLTDVATRLGVGRTTLSQRINQQWQMSFSDYVNSLRVAYAERLLAGAGSPLLSEIAELSGFSSDSSFYRAFRRHTGRTPRGN